MVVVAGSVVVGVSGGEVVVVASLVVVVTAVVVVVTALSTAAVEVGLWEGVRGGLSGTVVVGAEVVGILEAGGFARLGLVSDPVRHAPRSNGTAARETLSFLGICPERRAIRELSHRC